MKREHHTLHPPLNNHQHFPGASIGAGVSSSSAAAMAAAAAAKAKAKCWEDEITSDAGMDELLAVLGYKVKSSDMAEVAQKLEQLDEVMVNASCQDQDGGISQLVSDTVHYNPSDISTWLESMLSELNPAEPTFVSASTAPPSAMEDAYFTPAESSTITTSQIFDDSSPTCDYDLKAIPGRAIYSNSGTVDRDSKRLKVSVSPSPSPSSSPVGLWGVSAIPSISANPLPATDSSTSRPLVLVDSQENGIRLVHTLTACAEAVQQENFKLAEFLVKQIEFLAASQAGAMGKVAAYFAEALAQRIYRLPSPSSSMNPLDSLVADNLQMHFYETCPYLKFAHFTANQAILEAFAGKSSVHVIDFSMKQGMQWPALMQALALRPGGPPTFRLTGIGPPPPDDTDRLQEVGWKLAQFAETINVKFEYRGFVADSLADLDAATLDLRPNEAVAVNSIFELHRLLAVPGDIEKVLAAVREMNPEIVTVVEQEANHNGPVFLDRFMESLHYYSTLFDSLEGSSGGGSGGVAAPVSGEDRVWSEVYLGRQICNVVAREGADRVERHEPLAQWRGRFESAGFAPAHLGSNAFKQASMLLALYGGGDGYRVDENSGCLLLGWHTRPLIATSAWQLAGKVGGKQRNSGLS